MQQLFGLIAIVVVLTFPHILKRTKEVDRYGNPALRLLGISVVSLVGGSLFLGIGFYNLSDPFHQHHPENSFVEFTIGGLGLVASLWAHRFHIALTDDAIEEHIWPLQKTRVPLDLLVSIESKSAGIVLHFSDGHKIGIMKLYSGQKYFLESLAHRARIQTSSPD